MKSQKHKNMKTIALWIAIILTAGLTVYDTFFRGAVRDIIPSPTTVQVLPSPTQRSTALEDFDNVIVGNKLHITPIVSVSNALLGKDIGDIWNDAVNEKLRYNDGNSANGVAFAFADFYPTASGIYNAKVSNVSVFDADSSNINGADSMDILPAPGEDFYYVIDKMTFILDEGIAYDESGTDSTFVYTTVDSLPSKLVYIKDTFFTDSTSVGYKVIPVSVGGSIDKNSKVYIKFAPQYTNGDGSFRIITEWRKLAN